MGDTYNPQNGSRYIYDLSQYTTNQGTKLLHSLQGGKKKSVRFKSRPKSRKKKYSYSKYASVYKKQQSYKFNRRKRK